MAMIRTAGDLAHLHGLTHLTTIYDEDVPNDWVLEPAGGWPEECGNGDCTPEYVNLPDGSCAAIACDEHHPRN